MISLSSTKKYRSALPISAPIIRRKTSKKSSGPKSSSSLGPMFDRVDHQIDSILELIASNSPNRVADIQSMPVTNDMVRDLIYAKPGSYKAIFDAAGINIFTSSATDTDYHIFCQLVLLYCIINPAFFRKQMGIRGGGPKKSTKGKQKETFRNRIILLVILLVACCGSIYMAPAAIRSVLGKDKRYQLLQRGLEAVRTNTGIDLVDDSSISMLTPVGRDIYWIITGTLFTLITTIILTFTKMMTSKYKEHDRIWGDFGKVAEEEIESTFSRNNARRVANAARRENESTRNLGIGIASAIGGGISNCADKLIGNENNAVGYFKRGMKTQYQESMRDSNSKLNDYMHKIEEIDLELASNPGPERTAELNFLREAYVKLAVNYNVRIIEETAHSAPPTAASTATADSSSSSTSAAAAAAASSSSEEKISSEISSESDNK